MSFLRLGFFALATLLAGTASALAAQAFTTTNTTVYGGPGTNYNVVGSLSANTQVEIGDCTAGFCQAQGFGWIRQNHLDREAQAPQPQPNNGGPWFDNQPQPQPQAPKPNTGGPWFDNPPQPQPPAPQPPSPQPPKPQPPAPQPPDPPSPKPPAPPAPWPQPFPPAPWPPAPPPPPAPPVYDEVSACFYSGQNFTGQMICLDAGDIYNRLNNWNDRIRSVEVFGGARVEMCSDPNFYGYCTTIDYSASRLPFSLDANVTSLEIY